MATLVLTTVGTALGGPIGGALGALIGQSVDSSLFAPTREGPRLDSLAVQTSRYGTPIPLLFGRMRTAGTVIWASDLTERRSTTGGKGKPKVTSYAYTADFAVALSARPIAGIGRIWADGALITNADGRLSVDGTLRVHRGGEDQAADPLIEAEEARGRAPAYRGLAYAVFEGLALESFGNRVPMLSFEVIADDAPVTAGAMVATLSGGLISSGSQDTVAATGGAFAAATRRGALGALLTPLSLDLGEVGGRPALVTIDDAATPLPTEWLGARAVGEDAVPPVALADRPAATSVAIDFAEPARDHQPGRQRASVGGADARPEEHALPLALDAPLAKALAAARLDRAQGTARTARVALPMTAASLALAPGSLVRLPELAGAWRVEDWLLERSVVRLELTPVVRPLIEIGAADGGRADTGRPAPNDAGARAWLLDLPYLTADGRERLYAALVRADGTDRPLPLLLEREGAAEPIGLSAPAAVTGRLLVPPGPSPAPLLDLGGWLEVRLDGDADLVDADDDRLAAGDNALLVGDEIVQFGRAGPKGDRRWRLTRLLRGRRGTDLAIGTALAGDRVVLLDAGTLQPLAEGRAGGPVALSVDRADAGVGDVRTESALGVPPLPPVHLSVTRAADGSAELGWVRQSRAGWSWVDGADAPLAEEREAYEVTLGDRTLSVDRPGLRIDAASAKAPLAFAVRQIGTHGPSLATRFQEEFRP